ncbi:MAG TPA: hypothetical protein VIW48_07675 [Nitrospiraceae bacterium]
MTISKLQDVCNQIVAAVQAALASNNAPGTGQVYVAWPTGTEEVQKLGQPTPEGSITVYPIKGAENATRYPSEPAILTAPQNSLIAVMAANTVTFSGVCDQAYNIHGFIAGKNADAYYQTTANQTLAQVATAYAAVITALSIGLTASATGVVATLSAGQFTVVNVGSTGKYAIEKLRIRRTIQISIWINDATTRWTIADIITTSLGTAGNHFLSLTDGTQAYISYLGDLMDDSSESSYSLYAHHIYYDVEYGQVASGLATQIEGFETTTQINQLQPVTAHFG